MKEIKLTIITGNAFNINADVLVMKYAQGLYGLDRSIVRKLFEFDPQIESKLPPPSGYYYTPSKNITETDSLIFIGVPNLSSFLYKEIREFARRSLLSLASEMPKAKKVAMTIHGPGYGLDEIEAFESQIAGLTDSINSEDFPANLEEIIFVERSEGRAQRIKDFLISIIPNQKIVTKATGGIEKFADETTEMLRSAGYESESKKKIFVAMPFSEEFEDVFYFGIQGAVKNAGYLCERADLESYTGDVMNWVKKRIENSEMTIADLTGANANVYLEVGYAWGRNKETILLVKDSNDLKFDVRGQRCLVYKNIKDLMEKLENELKNLNNDD